MERNKLLYQKSLEMLTEPRPKYNRSGMGEDDKNKLEKSIRDVFESDDSIFKESFGAHELAGLVGAGYNDVSQVINERFGQTFPLLLSEYRVKEACKRLNDLDHYGMLTIDAIGFGVGFKNRSSFSRAFKRVTQLSPSEYRKQAIEQQNQL